MGHFSPTRSGLVTVSTSSSGAGSARAPGRTRRPCSYEPPGAGRRQMHPGIPRGSPPSTGSGDKRVRNTSSERTSPLPIRKRAGPSRPTCCRSRPPGPVAVEAVEASSSTARRAFERPPVAPPPRGYARWVFHPPVEGAVAGPRPPLDRSPLHHPARSTRAYSGQLRSTHGPGVWPTLQATSLRAPPPSSRPCRTPESDGAGHGTGAPCPRSQVQVTRSLATTTNC